MKKFLSMLLLISTLTLAFASCEIFDNTNTSESDGVQDLNSASTDDTDTPSPPQGVIFEENSDPYTEGLLFKTVPDEEGYVVAGYEGPAKDVIIPKIYRGFYVIGISDDAFYKITKLETVSIPDSVHYIGKRAFNVCYNLTDVTIPDSVTIIGDDSFRDCRSLTSITIPDSVTKIGSYAFSGCMGLTSVTLPNSITSIGMGAFRGCSDLTSVTIPGVTRIAADAFRGCSGLTSVVISHGVTSIGDSAFMDCTSLTSVTIPNSVTSIEDDAFNDCMSLVSITIPDSVTSIGNYAFEHCGNLTKIIFEGTQKQWDDISKEDLWCSYCARCSIHCIGISDVNSDVNIGK